MAHIISSCNPLPRMSHITTPNFKGKEKQILQMPGGKWVRIRFWGGGDTRGLWPGSGPAGWSVGFVRKAKGAVGAHSVCCVTLGVWQSKCRSWRRGRKRMGWDILNMVGGRGSENGGISPEELQPRPLFPEEAQLLGISGLAGESWDGPGLPWCWSPSFQTRG